MANESKSYLLKAWSEMACFSDLLKKPDQYSYPIIPPTAIDGFLKSIFYKQEFYYKIEKVFMLNRPEYCQFTVNYVKGTFSNVFDSSDKKRSFSTDICVINFLINPQYIFKFKLIMNDEKADSNDNIVKLQNMIERTLLKGRSFSTPYFGMRENVAYYELYEEEENKIKTCNYNDVLVLPLKRNCTKNNKYIEYEKIKAKIINGVMELN